MNNRETATLRRVIASNSPHLALLEVVAMWGNTHTHTHTFNDPFPGTTQVSRYQKGTSSSAIAEGPRDSSCQLKYCQLPRNSAETTYTTSPDQIDGMKLEI